MTPPPDDQSNVHPLLARQLSQYLGPALPESLRALISEVDATYRQVDADRLLLERSLKQMLIELLDRNQHLQHLLDEYRLLEDTLRDREARQELVTKATNDGLWDWDLQTNTVYFSASWKALIGFVDQELSSEMDSWFERIHAEDAANFKLSLDAYLAGRQDSFAHEYRLLHSDGSYRWMLSRGSVLRDERGQALRLAGSQTDITRRKADQELQRHAALHDPLTDLPNRTLFMDHLGQAIDRARENPKHLFAVLFLDLDRFKVINDSLGHLMGDRLLISIAQRLQACVRPYDTIARLGGDEFTILMEEIDDLEVVTNVADRIQREVSVPFLIGGHEVFTTVSIGIAINTRRYDRPENLLRDADTAMYRAKMMGKARYEVFHSDMHDHAMALLRLEAELRRALERQEFVLHYQPIISLSSGKICGCEALIRWQHPQRGLLFPSEFIHLVEETGMIVPLDEWSILTACTQIKAWQNLGLPTIFNAVNISARTFKQQALIALMRRILVQSGLEPRYLELELNESTMIGHADETIGTMQALKALGIRLSIDDFGTGYSSLSYLKRLPLDTLKIDRSFVTDITTDAADAAIATTITRLARSLNLQVIAEGIENDEQLAYLEMQHCDQFQGYLFSKPLPADQFAELLAAGWDFRTRIGESQEIGE